MAEEGIFIVRMNKIELNLKVSSKIIFYIN